MFENIIGCLRPLRLKYRGRIGYLKPLRPMKKLEVRVKIKIVYDNKPPISSTLTNTGYESDFPEVFLPVKAAVMLGL